MGQGDRVMRGPGEGSMSQGKPRRHAPRRAATFRFRARHAFAALAALLLAAGSALAWQETEVPPASTDAAAQPAEPESAPAGADDVAAETSSDAPAASAARPAADAESDPTHAAPAKPVAPSTAVAEPATSIAEPAALATRSLILDIADGANRAIAVGERGHILVSESRRDWRQVEIVPTRSTLTAVTTAGDSAWAVGHDGVILASTDGGLTWSRQRAAPYDPEVDDLHNGVPLLDVWFADPQNGIAIGAYALMLKTRDGGASWTAHAMSDGDGAVVDATGDGAVDAATSDVAVPADGAADAGTDAEAGEKWTFSEEDLELEEESDPHLNAITRTGDGSLFIVAERGIAFRSTDAGESWRRIKMPYQGSMFGVIGYDGRRVLAFGLRGHAFESTDLGDNWTEVETGTDLSLLGGTGWTGGGAALVGANGIVLTRSAAGSGLLAHTHPDGVVLSSVSALSPNGELIVVGENGVSLYNPQ